MYCVSVNWKDSYLENSTPYDVNANAFRIHQIVANFTLPSDLLAENSTYSSMNSSSANSTYATDIIESVTNTIPGLSINMIDAGVEEVSVGVTTATGEENATLPGAGRGHGPQTGAWLGPPEP